ncbi:hypothetical protein [Bradyrhizobium sp. RD5-C2]|uniref:hypothetical protein n=1 Tax=Bradyrhizobium sp. RD5-C2 TaxID=244562 RepID=UPI001CC42075|nr:hypothetical protein [Bradyrhizobium sp. RD5-C2]GIQ73153.1 hypothetical protein BraRD5C2_15910 [Bradyrhizobium sp. RD5-C2]
MPILFVVVLSPSRIGIGELGVNAEQALQDCDEAKAAEEGQRRSDEADAPAKQVAQSDRGG